MVLLSWVDSVGRSYTSFRGMPPFLSVDQGGIMVMLVFRCSVSDVFASFFVLDIIDIDLSICIFGYCRLTDDKTFCVSGNTSAFLAKVLKDR